MGNLSSGADFTEALTAPTVTTSVAEEVIDESESPDMAAVTTQIFLPLINQAAEVE